MHEVSERHVQSWLMKLAHGLGSVTSCFLVSKLPIGQRRINPGSVVRQLELPTFQQIKALNLTWTSTHTKLSCIPHYANFFIVPLLTLHMCTMYFTPNFAWQPKMHRRAGSFSRWEPLRQEENMFQLNWAILWLPGGQKNRLIQWKMLIRIYKFQTLATSRTVIDQVSGSC